MTYSLRALQALLALNSMTEWLECWPGVRLKCHPIRLTTSRTARCLAVCRLCWIIAAYQLMSFRLVSIQTASRNYAQHGAGLSGIIGYQHDLHQYCHHPLLLLTSAPDSKLIFSTNLFLHSSSTFPPTGLTPRTPAVFRFSRACRF